MCETLQVPKQNTGRYRIWQAPSESGLLGGQDAVQFMLGGTYWET